MQDFPFTSIEPHEVPVSLFLQPVKVLWMAAQLPGISATPSSFASSAKRLRVHAVPSFWSVMKMLNCIDPGRSWASCCWSQVLEPTSIPVFTSVTSLSLCASMRFGKTSPLRQPCNYLCQEVVIHTIQKWPGLLVPYLVALGVNIRVAEVPHENQGRWPLIFSSLNYSEMFGKLRWY